ncbi:alpha/beta hydrolase [Bradyrhizobium sp. 27S5]|uniref:alpha/beta hydrolase n=1 Tax=Bradyrhizobium sp. 27S5 TaxID=3139728 RepID=UPI0030CEC5E6
MRKLLAALLAIFVTAALIPVIVIVLNAPTSPPAMISMAAPFRQMQIRDVPTPLHFKARDGASLQYYAYSAGSEQVAVLIHGSVDPGPSMHVLATTLRAVGITTYVLDVRGHGGSGLRGDIEYIGQIDDDLADFVGQLGPAKSGEHRTLVGFSAGAGFAVRFAGGPYGLLFDRYVFLAPILPGAATLRTNAGGWTNVAVPRIVSIAALNQIGIHWFDALNVVSYATSPQNTQGTPSYSYRLAMNFGAGRRHERYLRNIRRPATILVGSADEQVVADQFEPLVRGLGIDIPVVILPGLKHVDMILAPKALQAIGRLCGSSEAT